MGLNQKDFARLTPTGTRQTQSNYEKGAREPDALYLVAAAKAGADVQYIVTGERGVRNQPIALDPALLRGVIEGVEEALQGKARLSPEKKAELITLLYEHFSPQKIVERPTIQRFLRLVGTYVKR